MSSVWTLLATRIADSSFSSIGPGRHTLFVTAALALGLSVLTAGDDLFTANPLPEVQQPGTWFLQGPQAPLPPSAGVRPGRPSMRGIGWQVADYMSAHGVLIVTVETQRFDEATGIAHELVQPLKDGYVEVLVYFRQPGRALATTRVQWTPSTGYIETNISSN